MPPGRRAPPRYTPAPRPSEWAAVRAGWGTASAIPKRKAAPRRASANAAVLVSHTPPGAIHQGASISVVLRRFPSGASRIVSISSGFYRSLVRQTLPFHVVGVSHHTSPVEERERFAFSASEIASLLEDLKVVGLPGLLLSTCNRCELYWYGPEDGETWFRALARGRNPTPQ